MVKTCVALLLLLSSALALAQPMMLDPSKMSGIPRPDPQVPAGTITVRLIRGELSNRMTGVDVALADADGKMVTQKTDGEGRATFSGLVAGGTYTARATDGIEELQSQPIALQSDMGSRVMLVFTAEGGADQAADGVARPDKSLPAGVIIVRALGPDGKPEPNLPVVLGKMRQGEQGVMQQNATTNADGEVRFAGQDAKPTTGYAVEIQKQGARFGSKPFKLKENMGMRVNVSVLAVSHDLGALKMGPGSHFIFEVSDDVVEVVEVLRLMNETANAVDTGAAGLHIPLPDKALQAQSGPQSPPALTVAGHEAVLHGPVAPGDTELQISYVLPYQGDALDLVQRTTVPFETLAYVSEKMDNFRIEGDGLTAEERELSGRKVMLYRSGDVPANSTIVARLRGLPHADPTWRYVSLGLALALAIGFGVYAAGGGSRKALRQQLDDEREKMLGKLVELERAEPSPKRDKQKAELMARLSDVYRQLDEVDR